MPGNRVSAEWLEKLRKAQLAFNKASVAQAKARLNLEKVTLEIEIEYGLLATDATLNPNTGEITRPDKMTVE